MHSTQSSLIAMLRPYVSAFVVPSRILTV